MHPLGTWPNPDLPGLQSQPHLVECQAPGQLSSQQGGGRQAGRPQRQCVSQRAARGPSWQAACSHTWLNRDNGGCFFSSASSPQAGLQVLEAPEHPQSPADNRASWEAANRPCRDFPGRAARPVSWPLYREREAGSCILQDWVLRDGIREGACTNLSILPSRSHPQT